jgi:hypothetical protein
MLRVSQLFIAGLAVIAAPGLQAECTYPEEVLIPDGAASTYEEMRDSQTYVKEYMAEMETYLECLEQQDSVLANELTDERELNDEGKLLHLQQRREAIDTMESVAAKFNEQVRVYKQANP